MKLVVDTNILLCAVNGASEWHANALRFLEKLMNGSASWGGTWPIVYEFFRVSTHPKVFPRPLKCNESLKVVLQLFNCQTFSVLTHSQRHVEMMELTLKELHNPIGNIYHDIHTAVLMREYGITEICTADSDFLRFPFLTVTNPLKN